MKISRRNFILSTTVLGLAKPAKILARTETRRIIVAGAGLSGLSTAYELSKLGYHVTVLEGRNRVGGRVFTMRQPFSGGLHLEVGGELIGDGYKRMLGYAYNLGVNFYGVDTEVETGGAVASLQAGIGTTTYMKGNLYPVGSVLSPHPYGLTGDESQGTPSIILARHLRQMAREIDEGKKTLADYDKMSLAEALRARGVSDTAVKLIDITLNANSIESVSAGGALFDFQRRQRAGRSPYKIKEGNDKLVGVMAAETIRNGARIFLQSDIKKITYGDPGVRVTFVDAHRRTVTVEADKLVCTIPFSVLRNVAFSPALPEAKMKAINEIPYTKVTKVILQAQFAEWDRRTLGSSIWTDTNAERIFSATGNTGDLRALFTMWADGDGAAFMEKLPPTKRMAWARSEFTRILPFMKGSVEKTATISWTQEPFSRGAFSHSLKGQLIGLRPNAKTTVGPIHFAGEHTAEKFPGMEGALESAERVVNEITGKA